MSDFDDAFAQADEDIFSVVASQAIYDTRHIAHVIVELDVQQFGSFETTMPARRHEVSFLVSEIPNPKRGQTIETEGSTYTLDGSISNDGGLARWHINES